MSTESRSIAGAFEPLLPLGSPEEVPMVVAILERIAGSKYRVWTKQAEGEMGGSGYMSQVTFRCGRSICLRPVRYRQP